MSNTRKVKAAIRAAKLPERSVELCLRGDLVAQFEALQRELERLGERPKQPMLTGDVEAREVAKRIEAVREQMRAHTVTFTMRAMSRRRWTEFVAGHEPRKGVESDQTAGFNTKTLYEALVRESTVDPQLTDEEWAHLLDEVLSDAQFETLAGAAWELNRKDVSVPFSFAASVVLGRSQPE